MSWSDRYLGIPWSRHDRGAQGTHCWGLVRLVYAEQLEIELEDFGAARSRLENAAVVADRRRRWPWRIVDRARAFDVVVFRRGRFDDHIGIMIDARLMLHVDMGNEALVDDVTSPEWRSRVAAFHRHVARMEAGDV